MDSLSYTFSSSSVLDLHALVGRPTEGSCARKSSTTASQAKSSGLIVSVCRRLPMGMIIACFLITLFHTVATCIIFPEPIARETLRQKVIALTADCRPSMLIAGDSRAETQIIPAVVAFELNLPIEEVANIAVPACESTAVLAAYREFKSRFRQKPVLLLSVSIWSVNDTSYFKNDDALWAFSMADRLRLVSPGRALTLAFSSERLVLQGAWQWLTGGEPMPTFSDQGYVRKEGRISEEPNFRQRADTVLNGWYSRPEVKGLRWQRFRTDLQSFLEEGVQLVIIDPPTYPGFLELIKNTEAGQAEAQFHQQLKRLCRELGVPLLQYQENILADQNSDYLFRDLVHLNDDGARILSKRAAEDVRNLLNNQALVIPCQPQASCQASPL